MNSALPGSAADNLYSPSLLISALGIVPDVRRCVSMDLKEPGNFLYLAGITREELGGSHFALVNGLAGGRVPRVDAPWPAVFTKLSTAIQQGLVRACHDLSEGGLAVAAAEMAFAGGCGLRLFLAQIPHEISAPRTSSGDRRIVEEAVRGRKHVHPLAAWPAATPILLFSESNSRLLLEVRPADVPAFEALFAGLPCRSVGEVREDPILEIVGLPVPAYPNLEEEENHLAAPVVVRAPLAELKAARQAPVGLVIAARELPDPSPKFPRPNSLPKLAKNRRGGVRRNT